MTGPGEQLQQAQPVDPGIDGDDLEGWITYYDDGSGPTNVTIWRKSLNGGARESLGRLEPDEATEETIRERWGGGTYYARIRKGGAYRKMLTLKIAGEPIQADTGAGATSGAAPAAFQMPAFTPGTDSGPAMVTAVVGAMATIMQPVLAILAERQAPAPASTGIADMVALVKLGRDLRSDDAPPAADGMGALVAALAPGINAAFLSGSNKPASVAPAPTPTPAAAHDPPPPPETDAMWDDLFSDLAFGVSVGADPARLADALAASIDADRIGLARIVLGGEDTRLAVLAAIERDHELAGFTSEIAAVLELVAQRVQAGPALVGPAPPVAENTPG